MPGQTANYAIPFPCPGDNVDCTDFADWATAIDTAIATVASAAQAAQNKPKAMGRTVDAGTAVAAGAGASVMNVSTSVYLDQMVTSGTTFNPINGKDGIYVASAQFSPVNTATTVTSFKASIVLENQVVASKTLASSTGTTIARPINLIGLGSLLFAGVGGQAQFEWTGTGGPLNIYCQLSFAFVAPL